MSHSCVCKHGVSDHFGSFKAGYANCSVPDCTCEKYTCTKVLQSPNRYAKNGASMSAKESTYDRYKAKADKAKAAGFFPSDIIHELDAEKNRINQRCSIKVAELSCYPSPYPAREARRAATECIMVINRLIKEIQEASNVPATAR